VFFWLFLGFGFVFLSFLGFVWYLLGTVLVLFCLSEAVCAVGGVVLLFCCVMVLYSGRVVFRFIGFI
jgi:hypothetical protein